MKPWSETQKTWAFLPALPLVTQLIPRQVLCATTVLPDLCVSSLEKVQDKCSSSMHVKHSPVSCLL